jgi:antitoxin ParD1/3/4
MNVSIGDRWERFVSQVVDEGRYGSASEVVREGLRLVEEREARLLALRQTVQAAIDGGGNHSSEDVADAVTARLDSLGLPPES